MKGKLSLMLLVILLILPYASAASVIDESQDFINPAVSYTSEVPQKALLLAAIASTVGKAENTSVAAATVLDTVSLLEDWQNPDGGWGHFKGSVSTPADTALVLVALSRSKHVVERYSGSEGLGSLDRSIDDGRDYLFSSFDGRGWGYVKGSPTSFYPTVLSLWALGELGFNVSNSLVVEKAADYVASFTNLTPEFLALRLIAFKAIGRSDSDDLPLAKELLRGSLSMTERSMLTYALVLYEPFSFETAQAMTILENAGQHNGTYFLISNNGPILYKDSITPTAYAVMAFSMLADELSKGSYFSPKSVLCSQLKGSQNPDGGWGIYPGDASSAEATYYAVLALHACTPVPEGVEKAVEWASSHLERAEDDAKLSGMLTPDYYYTALILAQFGNLSLEEKEGLMNFTRSLQYAPGLWRGFLAIPQPYETAMGLSLLQALGDSSSTDVQNGKAWLLSISGDGWGLLLSPLSSTMVKDVPTTVTVLEALSGISTVDELKPHLDWLMSQRLPDGSWGYFKEYTNMLGEVSEGEPSVEYTVRAGMLLEKFGYDVGDFLTNWTLDNLDLATTTVDKALTLLAIKDVEIIPEVYLYEVINSLQSGLWEVNYPADYAEIATNVSGVLNESEATFTLKENSLNFTEGNHVVLAPFGDFNVSRYNRGLSVEVDGGYVVINGVSYPKYNTILIAPGRTQNGYVLAVLFEGESSSAVDTIFSSGLYRYIHGSYLVLKVEDSNGDGIIEPDEIIPVTAG